MCANILRNCGPLEGTAKPKTKLPRNSKLSNAGKLKVSQEEFADMCELDRTYIGGIKRGERNVSLVNIEKVADTLDISVSEVFKGA
jgi:DNA-binding XRE family transcriptional regulator